MTAPRNGWKFVAWWASGLGAALGLVALGQIPLAAAVVGGLLGATVPNATDTTTPKSQTYPYPFGH